MAVHEPQPHRAYHSAQRREDPQQDAAVAADHEGTSPRQVPKGAGERGGGLLGRSDGLRQRPYAGGFVKAVVVDGHGQIAEIPPGQPGQPGGAQRPRRRLLTSARP